MNVFEASRMYFQIKWGLIDKAGDKCVNQTCQFKRTVLPISVTIYNYHGAAFFHNSLTNINIVAFPFKPGRFSEVVVLTPPASELAVFPPLNFSKCVKT